MDGQHDISIAHCRDGKIIVFDNPAVDFDDERRENVTFFFQQRFNSHPRSIGVGRIIYRYHFATGIF